MTVLSLITRSVSATIDFPQCLPLWTRQMKAKSISTSAVSFTALVMERGVVRGAGRQIAAKNNPPLQPDGILLILLHIKCFQYKFLIYTRLYQFLFFFFSFPSSFVYAAAAKAWIGTLLVCDSTAVLCEAMVQWSSRPHSRDLTLPMGASLKNFNREYDFTAGSCLMSLGHRSLWQHFMHIYIYFNKKILKEIAYWNFI